MKTVTSRTKKEYISQAKQAVALTAKFLTAWTEHQVQSIAINERTPYIWPLGRDGYAIGTRRVLQVNGYWRVENISKELLYVFEEKTSAIFFCLCEQSGRHSLADSIASTDDVVRKLRNDVVHYEASVERAIKGKNSEKISIWSARLYDAKIHLKHASNELQKSLTSAKYIKYWE
jgi:hypothetical protein